jgi:UBX domain-containing protein 1
MLNVEFGQAVEVKVMQKLDEDFTPPPKVLKPFQGAGHKLGG